MTDEPHQEREEENVDRLSAIDGRLGAFTANLDQLEAGLGRTLEGLAALAFALGVLAAIVALQHRTIKALTNQLAE